MTKTTFFLIALTFNLMTVFAQSTTLTVDSNDSGVDAFSHTWDDGVVLTATRITGEPANVIYDNEFADKGFGIKGARWKQIDFYQDYQGINDISASEQLIIDFNGPVNQLEITLGMMGLNEGIGSDDETGKWTAYDSDDNEIGSGEIGPAESELGTDNKMSGSYGKYPFGIDVGGSAIYKIVIEATGFGYGLGAPKYVNSYNNDSGNTENNSDFNLFRLEYERMSLGASDLNANIVSVYPNPTKSDVTLTTLQGDNTIKLVSMYDVTGKRVKVFSNGLNRLNLSDIRPGIYLMKIELENGNQATKKIVKL